MVKNNGYPDWSKIEVRTKIVTGQQGRNNSTSDTFALIPLIPQDEQRVKSVLHCKIADSIDYRLLKDKDYWRLGFTNQSTSVSPSEFLSLFLFLENKTFNKTVFKLNDGRLFKDNPIYSDSSISQIIKYKNNDPVSSGRTNDGILEVWTCYTLVGPQFCDNGQVTGNYQICSTTDCDYVWWWISSSTNYNEWLPPDPTDPGGSGLGDAGTGTPIIISLDEVLLAWDNNIIIDTTVRPCIRKVLDSIRAIETGTIARIITTFSGNIPGFDVELKEVPQFFGVDSAANAITDYSSSFQRARITLNQQINANATNLSIARTLLHEFVHAFLVDYFQNSSQVPQAVKDTILDKSYGRMLRTFIKLSNPMSNDEQHIIIQKYFINDIAQALKYYCLRVGINNPDIDLICEDMAWGGLQDIDAYFEESVENRERIIRRLKAELSGIPQQVPGIITMPVGSRACF